MVLYHILLLISSRNAQYCGRFCHWYVQQCWSIAQEWPAQRKRRGDVIFWNLIFIDRFREFLSAESQSLNYNSEEVRSAYEKNLDSSSDSDNKFLKPHKKRYKNHYKSNLWRNNCLALSAPSLLSDIGNSSRKMTPDSSLSSRFMLS